MKLILSQHWRDAMTIVTALLVIGSLVLIAYGVHRNNDIANNQREHIDCIVKLLSTPSQPGQTRRIVDLSQCQIKVGP